MIESGEVEEVFGENVVDNNYAAEKEKRLATRNTIPLTR